MKKILITGADSYVGTSFEKYVKENYPDDFSVDTLDMRDVSWSTRDFSDYDAVFHVAGIAHSDAGKVSDEIRAKYYSVNTELTVRTAEKAKKDGVKQFIFMSSMIVFGTKRECITENTIPDPDNFYGDSKLEADKRIHKLQSDDFNVVSLRPPMIYGKNSKGNYPRLKKFANMTFVFPKWENKRSMLYIENLCEFVRLIINNDEHGYFYPQNREYVNTSDLVRRIALSGGKHIFLTRLFNPMIRLLRNNTTVKKVFGNLYYEKDMSRYISDYNAVSFEDSVKKSNE